MSSKAGAAPDPAQRGAAMAQSAPQWSADGWGAPSQDAAAAAAGQAAAHSDDEAPPQRRYGLGPMLGVGGMGRVVLGHDPVLGRSLAIKEALTPEAAPRLRREAQILASLDHPSIVAIYDADLRVPWFAMRMVPGRTWSAALAERPTLPERLALMRQLLAACEGVAHAHQRGVIHRDLKPDNILVDDFGATQVLDWGLAARLDDEAGDVATMVAQVAPNPESADATLAGTVLGTPAYLSPEAARGEALDRRADVWSLGLVLWQTLTGRAPWQGESVAAILANLRAGRSPLETSAAAGAGELPGASSAALPPELVAIACRAAAVDPAARYPDARALAADLERWLDGRRVLAHQYSQRELVLRALRTLRVPLAIGALATLVVAAVVGGSALRVRAERDRAQAALGASQRAQAALWAAQAVTNLRERAGPEAETAALAALSVGDAPAVDDAADARGVLAALGVGPRVTLQSERVIAGCKRVFVADDGGDALCVQADAISFWPEGATQARWRRPGTAQAAVWRRAGDRLALQVSNEQLQIVRTDDGEPVGPPVQAGGPQALVLAQGVVAQSLVTRVVRTRMADGLTLPPVVACAGAITAVALAPAATNGPTLWAACADGRIVDASDRTVASTPLHAPLADITAFVRADDGGFWVASSKGHLLRVPAAAPTVAAAAPLGPLWRPLSSMVRELRLLPGGWAALRGDRGEVRLVDLHAVEEGEHVARDGDVAALAGVAHGELGLDAEGRLWTGGAKLRRWAAPDVRPAAPALVGTVSARAELVGAELWSLGRRSVTGVCLLATAQGADVVLATGDGLVERLHVPAGRHAWQRVWRRRLDPGVIKAVACDGEAGRVWVGTMAVAGVVGIDAADGALLAPTSLPRPVRRLVAWGGGRWLAATFESGLWTSTGAGTAGAVPLAIGAASGDWVDLDGDSDQACAVESGRGRVVTIEQDDGATRLRELVRQPGARACAVAGAESVLVASEDRLRLHSFAADAAPWSVALPARPADLARDGADVAVALLNGDTHVVRVRDGLLLARLRGHQERVASVVWWRGPSPALWSASWDGSVRRWQPSVWRP